MLNSHKRVFWADHNLSPVQDSQGNGPSVEPALGVSFGLLLLAVTLLGIGVAFGVNFGFDKLIGVYVPPVLQQNNPEIASQMAKIVDQNTKRLEGYDAIDAAKGVFKLPIDQAMDRVVQNPQLLENPLEE